MLCDKAGARQALACRQAKVYQVVSSPVRTRSVPASFDNQPYSTRSPANRSRARFDHIPEHSQIGTCYSLYTISRSIYEVRRPYVGESMNSARLPL